MSNQNREDHRKNKRFPFREDILIEGVVKCTSIDISEGGIYFSTIQHFEQNSIINVTIHFDGKNITVKGQVQYSDQRIGMGIKFIDLTAQQRAEINKIIEKANKNL
jgi:hypothetical protein